MLVAVLRDRHAAHQLHHEIRPAHFGGSAVEDTRDVRMIHQRQRLSLGFEAGNDASGVHTQLDDFQGDGPVDWFLLLGHVHDSATAFADFLEQFVTPDLVARFFGHRDRACGTCQGLGDSSGRWVLKKLAGLFVCGEERLHLGTKRRVAHAFTIQQRGAVGGIRQLQRLGEKFFSGLVHESLASRRLLVSACSSLRTNPKKSFVRLCPITPGRCRCPCHQVGA